jgi:hypothetical protein
MVVVVQPCYLVGIDEGRGVTDTWAANSCILLQKCSLLVLHIAVLIVISVRSGITARQDGWLLLYRITCISVLWKPPCRKFA